LSYSIKVVVKDGVATVAPEGTTTGQAAPPDGTYNINGHVPSEGTWQAETIAVARLEPDDKGNDQMVVQASGTHHRVHLPRL
jgi:hypothetical protein